MSSFRRAIIVSVVLLLAVFFIYQRDLDSSFSFLPSTKPLQAAIEQDVVPEQNRAHVDAPRANNHRKKISDFKRLSLKDQLSYQFPYDVSSKFPAYIWQTWKYTPASVQFAEKFRVSEASWTEHHPTFVHEVITDEVALHVIRHFYSSVPQVLEAYLAMPLPILKADFFRYLILLARGGVYADIDTLALKPATDWIGSTYQPNGVGLVIGIEADPDRIDWADWYSRRIQFCQWTIQAKAGHPILTDIVVRITTETLRRKKEGTLSTDHDDVVEWTGPAIWSDAVFSYFNDPDFFSLEISKQNITYKEFTGMKQRKKVGDVVVLPITSFSPGVGHSGAGEPDDAMAFVQHEFEGSWKPDSERMLDQKGKPTRPEPIP